MTYVAIELSKLQVLFVIDNIWAAGCMLALQCQDTDALYVGEMSRGQDWQCFTDSQLVSLFRNVTGLPSICSMTRRQIIQVIVDAIAAIEPVKYKKHELELQCQAAEQMGEGRPRLQYVYGAYKPAIMGDGELPFAKGFATQENIDNAKAGKLPAFTAPQPVANPVPLPQTVTPAIAPATAPKQASTAPAGKVSAVIWDVAERIWISKGSPKEIKDIMLVRKEAMDELEKNGIKRTTASNELGNWQRNLFSR